jgi:hypothetical protein
MGKLSPLLCNVEQYRLIARVGALLSYAVLPRSVGIHQPAPSSPLNFVTRAFTPKAVMREN